MWARIGPPAARLLALGALLVARSFFRTERIAIATTGMLTLDGSSTVTGLNGWLLIELDRGNLVLTGLTGPALEFTFATDELWFSDSSAHWSSHDVVWKSRAPPIMHRTIGGQEFGQCFWVSWPMRQPPRTVGSAYLFASGGLDYQIALPLPLFVLLMCVPIAILRWQKWQRSRPRGFDVEVDAQRLEESSDHADPS